MNVVDKDQIIHLLSQELIVIIDELEPKAKDIVLNHMKGCVDCQQLYESIIDSDKSFPDPEFNESDKIEIKPLKKLAQFNLGLKLFLIVVRMIILFYIIYTGFKFHDTELAWITFDYINSGILLFYIPASVFLLVFTITFFNKKWIWISVTIDLSIIFFLSHILEWFL